jgi:GNAT superfamily N-acetyltransferase
VTKHDDDRTLIRRPLLVPSPLQKYMPGEICMEMREHVLLASLGDEGIEDNYAFVYGPVVATEVLAMAESFFRQTTYSIVVESGMADLLDELLTRQGWPIDEDVPSLLLTPIPDAPRFAPGLDIRSVSTEQEYADFMRVSETGRRWVPSLQAATDPDVCLCVGYWQGTPIATSRISCLGDVGEINGVVTDERYRRNGFGTAMTWAAIEAGKQRSCTSIVLSATDLGYPVYVKMGFVPVCNIRTYLKPESSVSTTSADLTHARRDN